MQDQSIYPAIDWKKITRIARKQRIKALFATLWNYLLKPFRWMKAQIIKRLIRMRAKLQIGTLKDAIIDADKDKAKTGRKNMVVFNTHSGKFEPLQKRLLKNVANAGKNTSNKAMTEGRKKFMKKRPQRGITIHSAKKIENKSLYVTR